MRKERYLGKLNSSINEEERSGLHIDIPVEIIWQGLHQYKHNINEHIALTVQLGAYMEQERLFQVFGDNCVKLNIDDFYKYNTPDKTMLVDFEFDRDTFKLLKRTLKQSFSDEKVLDWTKRLFTFSLIAPQLNLEVEHEGIIKKLDLDIYYGFSTLDNPCFDEADLLAKYIANKKIFLDPIK